MASSDSSPDMSVHTIPTGTTVNVLEATQAFDGLTEKEKLYALGISDASWQGSKICLMQCSPESVPIFSLLQLVFHATPIRDLMSAAQAKGLTEEEVNQAVIYCAAFYGNLGNYKSFGDTKFVPELPKEKMHVFLTAGVADADAVKNMWDSCHQRMYSLSLRERQMGLGSTSGITTYFSSNCEEKDAEIAGKFLESLQISPYNTRLFKKTNGDKTIYTVLIASKTKEAGDDELGKLCKEHEFEGHIFKVERGDYGALMGRVTEGLSRSLPHVANDTQKAFMDCYIDSFGQGSIKDHVKASRHWVKDLGPAVESYIGFIESYRDPSGARGEWEGFVACVNREVSKKFQALVDNSEALLKLMPWPAAFEKDKFIRPDFTSLDVLAFGSSGVPAGINIPNYDEVRQSDGFKNVSLGNVLQASYGGKSPKPVTFVRPEEQDMYKELQGPAFEVQVGIHELLGHGSGKLFYAKDAPSKDIINPLTGSPITGPFYADGASWDTVFSNIASPFEECRAECSGMFLCLEPSALGAFGHEVAEGAPILDITYINWLHMARAGLLSLEFYTPEMSKWRQAHMQARYCIFKTLLQAGQGLLEVRRITGEDGAPDLQLAMDRSLVHTVGKKAIGDLLRELQVHRALGDVATGRPWFEKLSVVDQEMLEFRAIVMARKEPRKLLIQPHVHLDTKDNAVKLKTFEATSAGMIESFVARFPQSDPELWDLYVREAGEHSYE